MDTLLSVLFYLNALIPGAHYTIDQINNYAAIYAPQITIIENTPGQLPPILYEYEPLAIIVWDDLHGLN